MDQTSQLNVEYLFRLIYDCFTGSCYGTAGFSGIEGDLIALWHWVTILGIIATIIGLVVIVYATIRLFELRAEEAHKFEPVLLAPSEREENPRWAHIQSLMATTNPSDWRQAIIEADIMLDDMLTRQGYVGQSIGDKLKQVNPASFGSLDDAWEAHKVRNDIAHQGSAYDFSELLARRTMARYENVFREFDGL